MKIIVVAEAKIIYFILAQNHQNKLLTTNYWHTHNKFIPLSGKIEKSFEFKWQMLLWTTVRGIVITWMNTAWLIKVMQLAGSLQTNPK